MSSSSNNSNTKSCNTSTELKSQVAAIEKEKDEMKEKFDMFMMKETQCMAVQTDDYELILLQQQQQQDHVKSDAASKKQQQHHKHHQTAWKQKKSRKQKQRKYGKKRKEQEFVVRKHEISKEMEDKVRNLWINLFLDGFKEMPHFMNAAKEIYEDLKQEQKNIRCSELNETHNRLGKS